jgi:hypothetical protein
MPTTSENTTASDLSFFDYLDGFARILRGNVVFPYILVMAIEAVLAVYIIKSHRQQMRTEEDLQYEIPGENTNP